MRLLVLAAIVSLPFFGGRLGFAQLLNSQEAAEKSINSAPQDEAEQVIFEYFQALREQRYHDAYSLISPDFKAKVPAPEGDKITQEQGFINAYGFWNYDNSVNPIVSVERLFKPQDQQYFSSPREAVYIGSSQNPRNSLYPTSYRVYAVDRGYKQNGHYSQFAVKQVPQGSGKWFIAEVVSVCQRCP